MGDGASVAAVSGAGVAVGLVGAAVGVGVLSLPHAVKLNPSNRLNKIKWFMSFVMPQMPFAADPKTQYQRQCLEQIADAFDSEYVRCYIHRYPNQSHCLFRINGCWLGLSVKRNLADIGQKAALRCEL